MRTEKGSTAYQLDDVIFKWCSKETPKIGWNLFLSFPITRKTRLKRAEMVVGFAKLGIPV